MPGCERRAGDPGRDDGRVWHSGRGGAGRLRSAHQTVSSLPIVVWEFWHGADRRWSGYRRSCRAWRRSAGRARILRAPPTASHRQPLARLLDLVSGGLLKMITWVPSLARLPGALLACPVARCTGPAAVRERARLPGVRGCGHDSRTGSLLRRLRRAGLSRRSRPVRCRAGQMRGCDTGDQGWEAEREVADGGDSCDQPGPVAGGSPCQDHAIGA